MSGLVEQLRAFVGKYDCPDSVVEEAVDRIAALEAEVSVLRTNLLGWKHAAEAQQDRAETAERKLAEARRLLEHVRSGVHVTLSVAGAINRFFADTQ